MTDIAFLSASEQADLVRSRELSPVELVTLYLERIDKHDSVLNSYVTVVGEGALEAARRAERMVMGGEALPRFHGVPISIKDLHETAGVRTTMSSKAYAEYVPAIDTSTVRRIKEAGFILLGKTNCPEFGTLPVTESGLNGVCRNPWDTDRTPGGSSGGAAAALAAGLCPVSHGSDGGGSIRIPASCCGVLGLKPARGRVSHAPEGGEVLGTLATDGPLARTVRDAASLLDVMAGYEMGDPFWAPEPNRPFEAEVGADPGELKVGFTTVSPLQSPVDRECVAATEDAAGLLEGLGHRVEEVTPDWFDDQVVANFLTLWQLIPAVNGSPDAALLDPINAAFSEMAEQTSSAQFIRSLMSLNSLSRRVVGLWEDYDLLLTPTLAMLPVPIGWIFEEGDPWMQFVRSGFFVPFAPIANLTGQPAVSLPLAWTASGLPVGVQLVGPPAGEALLLRVSSQIEAARPWAHRRPSVS